MSAVFWRSHVARLALRRILASVPVFIGISILSFFLVSLLPGNTVRQLSGAGVTEEQIALLEAELKLDQPVWQRYWEWLTDVVHGDFGSSLVSNQSVIGLIAERVPVTFELAAYAFFLALVVSIPMSLLSAKNPNGLADKLTEFSNMVSLSLANYVLAILLIMIFAIGFNIFPSIGFVPIKEGLTNNLRSLTLPAISLAFPLFGFYTRMLRNDLVEQMQSADYVPAATAKGLSEWQVLLSHAFRNSVFGLLTVIGLHMGTLIGGAVVIEQIFALPGLGQLLLQAINLRDTAVIQGVVLLLAVMTVLSNMFVDIIYTILDPRIRYSLA